MMRRNVAAAFACVALMNVAVPAGSADLTEEQVRKIAEEVATRVAREVAAEVAAEVAKAAAAAAAQRALEAYLSQESKVAIEFTPEFLADAEHIEGGKVIWQEQCAHCHGSRAYPGKAPKLKPKRYTPEFVFDRVTNGFRGMPPWKDVYDDEQRMDVVAWVLSRQFTP
jgi:mono/diheme cytochrome c family protein